MARAVTDARLLAQALRDPSGLPLDTDWTALVTIARAEQLIGTLACRLAGLPLPEAVAATLADARGSAEAGRRTALWEAEMARRALAPIGCPVVLLKGTAFVAAGLAAGRGRSIGDLDILVPRAALDAVETALLAAGWEWVKPDPYDDRYYRDHMHELPPLIHRDRDRMIDVHHTILPPTARITPDAAALIAASETLGNGLRVLAPADMIVHAAAHLFADGDLAGGLRNLWDVHCLIGEFGVDGLEERARHHGLHAATMPRGEAGAGVVRHRDPRIMADLGRRRPAHPAAPAGTRRLGPTDPAGHAAGVLREIALAQDAARDAGAAPVDEMATVKLNLTSS